jgi:hypothetical protein
VQRQREIVLLQHYKHLLTLPVERWSNTLSNKTTYKKGGQIMLIEIPEVSISDWINFWFDHNDLNFDFDKVMDEAKAADAAGDRELAHQLADYALCMMLIELGFEIVVDDWKSISKWYA